MRKFIRGRLNEIIVKVQRDAARHPSALEFLVVLVELVTLVLLVLLVLCSLLDYGDFAGLEVTYLDEVGAGGRNVEVEFLVEVLLDSELAAGEVV